MKLKLTVDRKARIEMLPLIDIVFLLLVFFIYAMLSMAVHHGLPVDLPTSSTAEIDKKLILAVSIKADGSIFLNEEKTLLSELDDRLRVNRNKYGTSGVLLFADNRLPYQKLFAVMDQIKTAGIDRISLQAEKETTP